MSHIRLTFRLIANQEIIVINTVIHNLSRPIISSEFLVEVSHQTVSVVQLAMMTATRPLFLFLFIISIISGEPLTKICLNYLSCYNENYLDNDRLEFHHKDHDVRSATSCGELCIREDPSTRLVLVKIIDMNERLVCACGDESALGNRSGTMDDFFYCSECPDDYHQKCGGSVTASVYQVYQNDGACRADKITTLPVRPPVPTTSTTVSPPPPPSSPNTPAEAAMGEPNVSFFGCYHDQDINMASVDLLLLNDSDTTVRSCADACNAKDPDDESLLYLTKWNGTSLLCGCG